MSPRRPAGPGGFSPLIALGVFIGAWILAFSLAAHLFTFAVSEDRSDDSLLFRLLNAGRAEISAFAYRQADLYFHKGVAFTRPPPLPGDPFRRLLDRVSPESVVHREGQDIREIMPWLRFTTRIAPHHIEGYLVTAFWLSEEAGRPDVAHQVLREALRHNPGAYALHLGRGKLFLRQKNIEAAHQAFSTALRCWPRSPQAVPEEALRFDRAEILTYRALTLECFHQPAEAIRDLEEVLTLFPERILFRERIRDLAEGRPSLASALHLADSLLKTRPPDDHHPDHDAPSCHPSHSHHPPH